MAGPISAYDDRTAQIAALLEAAEAALTGKQSAMPAFRKRATAALIVYLIGRAHMADKVPDLEGEIAFWRGKIRGVTREFGIEREKRVQDIEFDLNKAEWGARFDRSKGEFGESRPPLEADGAIDPETLEPLHGRISTGQVAEIQDRLAQLRAADSDDDREVVADLGHNAEGFRSPLVASDADGKTAALMAHPIDGPASDKKARRVKHAVANEDTRYQRSQSRYDSAIQEAV